MERIRTPQFFDILRDRQGHAWIYDGSEFVSPEIIRNWLQNVPLNIISENKIELLKNPPQEVINILGKITFYRYG